MADADAEDRMSYEGSNSRDEQRAEKRAAAAAEKAAARITSQFRERQNMTYELECNGATLVLRMFPDETESAWRVEARSSNLEDASVATASAPTREAAVRALAKSCVDARTPGLYAIDWEAVIRALSTVAAL